MAAPAPIVAAFTEEQAERVTGVSRRQMRYWARDFFAPSIGIESSGLSGSRFYSFRDLVCLRILNALRNEAKVPLQELRRVREQLKALGDHLWATTTLYVLGKRVVFVNPENGGMEEVVSGQGVLQIPLQIVAGRTEAAVEVMRGRKPGTIGLVERKRGVAQNQVVIAGTRVPVRSIQAFAQAGYSIGEINRQYPSLTTQDIEAAMGHAKVA